MHGTARFRTERENSESSYYDERSDIRSFAVPVAEQVWRLVKANKILIAAIIGACLALGIIVTLLMTPKYIASARVEISRVENNVTAVEGVQTEDQVLDRQYYETQYELLRSRSLAAQIVREGELVEDQAFLDAVGIGEFVGDRERQVSDVLLEHVQIDPVGTSNLVDVKFVSTDPDVSARVANLWAQEYIASNLNRRFGATNDARKFLEERLEQLRQRLESAERELIAYAAERNLFTIDTGENENSGNTASQTLVASDLQALNSALTEAVTERIAAESALQASRASAGTNDDAAITALRQRRAELAAELASLRTTMGESYPTVQATAKQVAQLDEEIAAAERRSGNAAVARFRQAVDTENSLRERVNQLRSEFVGQRQDSVQYNILQREVDTTRSLYNAILQRYREIGVAGVGENNIALVDRAEAPTKPFEPNLPRNILLSLLIGAAVAGGIILLREKLDQSLRDPADLPDVFGIPLLGSIPRIADDKIGDELASRHSELHEAYFNLYTNLGFLSENGVPKLVMLGSTRPAEGKSLSSVALAQILADRGKKVLLLDADMRHSGVGKYVDAKGSKGLSNFLRGEDDWQGSIIKGAPFDFDLLPAGRQPPNAAELLAGERLNDLLRNLGQHYDHVVIDGPPVLGLADAPLIASVVDGVVMIIEANRGKIRMIAQSLDRLEHGGGKVFGGVVTKLDERNDAYGYGYGYGYGFSYGRQPD